MYILQLHIGMYLSLMFQILLRTQSLTLPESVRTRLGRDPWEGPLPKSKGKIEIIKDDNYNEQKQ